MYENGKIEYKDAKTLEKEEMEIISNLNLDYAKGVAIIECGEKHNYEEEAENEEEFE